MASKVFSRLVEAKGRHNLPMLKQEESNGMAEHALTSFSHYASDKPMVLIADDSRVVRVSLKNILKDDCQVIEAENGQEAWDILCNTPSITLVFSDLSMPKLDGRGLLTKIRASDSSQIATMPFIVVTGNEESAEISQELTQLGADEVINKPFDPSNIRNFLTTLGDRNQQPDLAYLETDISQQDEIEPQSDFLSGVVDREHFMESASRELAFAIRNKNELAIALVKIDQIDEITNQYSDPAIEHILLTLVEIIKQHIHPDDILAYFGTGLFAILRPASNAIGTRYLGRRILEDLSSKQFYLGESEQVVSASIGISAPDIKPGTRLVELISLAEGRLKTASENGGNKVVDKGSETLTRVNLAGDTSELTSQSRQSSSSATHSQSASTRSASEIHRLAAEQVAEIKAKYGSDFDEEDDEASELIEHKQTIERLTNENRQLINEIAHWKNQSAEADNLRRQLFEVESQQQQLQLKFTELQNENANLLQHAQAVENENKNLLLRTETVESENNNLLLRTETIESENNNLLLRTETIESENKKILQRTEAVESDNGNLLQRAETVESENRDLLQRLQAIEIENATLIEESLTNSGNENQQFIKEENRHLQNQLAELTSRAEKAEVENDKSNQLVDSLKDNINLLNMQLDQLQQQLTEVQQKNQSAAKTGAERIGRGSTVTKTKSPLQSNSDFIGDSQNSDLSLKATPDSNLYSETSEPSSVHLFPDQDQIESKQQVKNKPAIPPFRVEPEPLLFKNGFHLSSFAIAGIIFTIMLIIGGVYLYTVFNDNPAVGGTSMDIQSGLSKVEPHTTPADSKAAVSSQQPSSNPTAINTPPVAEKNDVRKISDEMRLEKELTLRKMAEEEFNLKAQ
ncbi:MAG: response regulator [Candidatus Thiodiazotropha endolucinida]